MQEEAKLVGRESVAGGAVGLQVGLVILDEAFRPPTSAVDLLAQTARASHEPGTPRGKPAVAVGGRTLMGSRRTPVKWIPPTFS